MPAADGSALATDVCLPPGEGPFPTVLIRTPYDRRRHHAELRAWARRGFVAIAQDVRGRHGSAGDWSPYRNEAADGVATARWIRARSWSDGRVVAVGSSYAAHCALLQGLGPGAPGPGAPAPRGADAVIAAVPALGPTETAREETGPERLLARAGWWAAHGDRPDSDETALDAALDADPRLLTALPVVDLPLRGGRPLPSWPDLWRHTGPGEVLRRAPGARVPLLVVAGTGDPFAAEALRLWRSWGGPSARLLLGPWGHRLIAEPGPDADPAHRLPLGDLWARWARAALAGGSIPGRGGAVALGGTPHWLPFDGTEPARWSVHPLRADTHPAGTPGTDTRPGDAGPPPGRAGAALRLLRGAAFTADPERPVRSDDLTVPTTGTPDRCTAVLGPLTEPLHVVGEPEVRLTCVADTPVADWAVRLTVLPPGDGSPTTVTGVVRRRDPAGRTASVTVPLPPMARRLPAGTRLRLEIAGHHHPAHARNPHTGENPVTARRLLPSRRTVLPAGTALWLPLPMVGDPAPGGSPAAPVPSPIPPVDPVEELCR
ncbi:CocE/NonD family hydrolase [Streptomyces sp. ST2-7A]|uniref:CocE/NonD family hydrolase n=1 Tax=Streptomyces sp. ST2-7A TaxID=2907214 RepID=UPI001F2E806E|nr:CocE/NonD family hydrolase [Streptomyces sp. ST2-7A]MCE7083417.1 CocE/NonD family hydrolase [Streptomyces sp. ST2-7A]